MELKAFWIWLILTFLSCSTANKRYRSLNIRKQLEYLESLIHRSTFSLREDIYDLQEQVNVTFVAIGKFAEPEKAETRGKEELDDIEIELNLCSERIYALSVGLSAEKQISQEIRARQQDELVSLGEAFKTKFAKLESRLTSIETDFEDFKNKINKTLENEAVSASKKLSTCPLNGFIWESSCYVLNEVKLDWSSAVNECKARGGQLAVLDSEEEMRFVLPRLGYNTWIGGHDSATEGLWQWIEKDETIDFLLWEPGQPNETGDCMEAYNGHLNDERCEVNNQFVCEFVL